MMGGGWGVGGVQKVDEVLQQTSPECHCKESSQPVPPKAIITHNTHVITSYSQGNILLS